MPDIVSVPPEPKLAPLFSLDLGNNGGILAPRSADELSAWIRKEISFWNWLGNLQMGSHQESVNQGYRALANALGQFNEALQYLSSNESAFNERLGNITNQLSLAYRTYGLPHSSSKLAKRTEQLRQVSPQRALAYLYTQLPNPNGFQFEARDFQSWSGFIEGMAERTKIAEIPKSALRSATESVDELHSKMQHLIAEKQTELDQLHRTYDELTQSMATKELHRTETWNRFIEDAGKRHEETIVNHEQRMDSIESVFREKMALRGPVEYWSKRQEHHKDFAVGFGILSFILIVVGGSALALWASRVFGAIPDNGSPKAWQLASLVIVAVFLTWAIRLVIRLFLSHSHLNTDAAERVVMTQTYLALLEENKLAEEKDRSLILGALFRPASDGMVKEENIPHPMLEALTRLGSKG
jgi:hypothetical protein